MIATLRKWCLFFLENLPTFKTNNAGNRKILVNFLKSYFYISILESRSPYSPCKRAEISEDFLELCCPSISEIKDFWDMLREFLGLDLIFGN